MPHYTEYVNYTSTDHLESFVRSRGLQICMKFVCLHTYGELD